MSGRSGGSCASLFDGPLSTSGPCMGSANIEYASHGQQGQGGFVTYEDLTIILSREAKLNQK